MANMIKKISPFKPPAKFWSRSWASIIQLIINGMIKSGLVIGSYYLIKNLSGQIRSQSAINTNHIVLLIVIAFTLLLLRIHERYTAEKMSQRYINRIRSALLKRIMRASVRSIQQKTIGNLSSRLAGDLSAIKRWLSLGISRLVTHSILLMIIVGLIYRVNTQLGLYITATVTGLIIISMVTGNFLKNSIGKVRRNRIRIHSLLVERLASIATLRAMGKEQKEVRKINRQASTLEKNIAKQGIFLGILRGIGDASSVLLISLFFGFQYLNPNTLSTDEITALIAIILFINSPIRELGRVQEYFQGAKLSFLKLQELYEIPRIIRGKNSLDNVVKANGEIKIRNLNLTGTFDNLNLQAKSGDHIALIGKNGAGKSTLIQLLLGLIKAEYGSIKVNGISPQKTPSLERGKHIGVSGSDFKIIKSSLLDNLTYRTKEYNQNEFDSLIEFCQLQPLIKVLPDGIHTKVSENGNNFSSGEKAKIALFRALLGHPSLLILDEPENYLDKKGLEIIKTLLADYQGTIIIATHHKQLIALCNRQWNLSSNTNNTLTIIDKNESNTLKK